METLSEEDLPLGDSVLLPFIVLAPSVLPPSSDGYSLPLLTSFPGFFFPKQDAEKPTKQITLNKGSAWALLPRQTGQILGKDGKNRREDT